MEDIVNDEQGLDNDFEDSHLIDDDIVDADEDTDFDDLDLHDDDYSEDE